MELWCLTDLARVREICASISFSFCHIFSRCFPLVKSNPMRKELINKVYEVKMLRNGIWWERVKKKSREANKISSTVHPLCFSISTLVLFVDEKFV